METGAPPRRPPWRAIGACAAIGVALVVVGLVVDVWLSLLGVALLMLAPFGLLVPHFYAKPVAPHVARRWTWQSFVTELIDKAGKDR
jgi:predicted cobalt transporter CbtA